ncbi:MAG: PPK2 family polyphosphate kinase [Cyclobacteriaceae bacterium]
MMENAQKKIDLSKVSTTAPDDFSKSEGKDIFKSNIRIIEELQTKMLAQGKYSLLLILQGMDASGKDGTVREVFKRITPSGIRVHSFKKPTKLEFAHDFLWRVHQQVPEDGMIQIFNRSHYEDVLIQRVHQWIDEDTVHRRFQHINNFESLLRDSGTAIIKVYLHTSKEEQLIQLNERKTDPTKHWKHNAADFEERKHWDKYMKAYEDVFYHCGPEIPWHIVPADKNWYKEYLVSEIVRSTLEKMDLHYPTLEDLAE